jgi:transposase-like protein
METILSLFDFQKRFPSEEDCFTYLFTQRWPDGFRCPRCGNDTYYFIFQKKRFQCTKCRHQTTVTAGTVFHKLRQPLQKLFWAVYLIATSKKGFSAMELQRKLDIKTYRTAWLLMHKIRTAMASSDAFPLSQDVEVDETYIGGKKPGPRGRGAQGKSLVAVAVETDGTSMGRAYLDKLGSASMKDIESFVTQHLSKGIKVTSDAFKSYAFLKTEYIHNPIVTSTQKHSDTVLPKVHIVVANLKMWLLGTYNRLPSKYLQKYLDEFEFRFNRRWNIQNIFDKLLYRCLYTKTCTLADLKA